MSFEGNLPNRTLGRGRVFELTPIKTGERGSLTRSNDQRGSLTKSNEQRGSVASNFSNEDSKRGSMASRTGRDGYLVGRAHQKKAEWRNDAFLPRNIEGKQSQKQILALKAKMKNYDSFAAVVSVTGLVIAFIENEIFFTNGNKSNIVNHTMRGTVTATCALSMFFLLQHYLLKLRILKCKKIVYETTTLWTSPLFKYFLLEAFIQWIHCPPGLDVVITNRQLGLQFDISLDGYILFFMYARLYVLFRMFDHYTIWTNPRAGRVSQMNGFQADSKFAIKAYLKCKSFWVLTIGLGLSVLLFGLWIRIFERSYVSTSRYVNFDYVWNSFWCVIVTMTTIGYGDIYAETHLGRFVSIGACIWGVFLLSLFVVIMNNYAEMSKQEQTAFEEIEREKLILDSLRKEAAIVIQRQYRLRLLQRRNSQEVKKILLARAELIRTINNFKLKRNGIMSRNKRVNEIISDMQEKENEEIHNLLKALTPVKSIAVTIDQIQNLQYELNDCMVQVYENCQKMYSLALESAKGSLGIVKDLNDSKIPLYDLKGREVTDSQTGPNYALEFLRLKQESSQIGYSPLLKHSAAKPSEKMQTIKLESAARNHNNHHIEEESEDSSSSDSDNDARKSSSRLSQDSSESDADKKSNRRTSTKVQRMNSRVRKSSTGTNRSDADALSGILVNEGYGIYHLEGADLPGVVHERD